MLVVQDPIRMLGTLGNRGKVRYLRSSDTRRRLFFFRLFFFLFIGYLLVIKLRARIGRTDCVDMSFDQNEELVLEMIRRGTNQ